MHFSQHQLHKKKNHSLESYHLESVDSSLSKKKTFEIRQTRHGKKKLPQQQCNFWKEHSQNFSTNIAFSNKQTYRTIYWKKGKFNFWKKFSNQFYLYVITWAEKKKSCSEKSFEMLGGWKKDFFSKKVYFTKSPLFLTPCSYGRHRSRLPCIHLPELEVSLPFLVLKFSWSGKLTLICGVYIVYEFILKMFSALRVGDNNKSSSALMPRNDEKLILRSLISLNF